jgi:hypothetical protein
MRFLVGLAMLLAAACNGLTVAERGWCEDAHFGSVVLAAQELGLADVVAEAHGNLESALERGQDQVAALNAYYSQESMVASCRLAHDRELSGRPFVPPR